MKKLSKQTKSFIILFVFALIGTYLCLVLATELQSRKPNDDSLTNQDLKQIIYPQNAPAANNLPEIDTSSWKTYTDEKLGLSFKYRPDWQVKPTVKKDNYYITEIDPGKKYFNIKLYTSADGYYAMDSLPLKQVQIAGKPAINVSDMLFGVQNGKNYYTFDIGLSVSLKPDFNALVRSVNFLQ